MVISPLVLPASQVEDKPGYDVIIGTYGFPALIKGTTTGELAQANILTDE